MQTDTNCFKPYGKPSAQWMAAIWAKKMAAILWPYWLYEMLRERASLAPVWAASGTGRMEN